MQVELNTVLLKAEGKLKDRCFDILFWKTKSDIVLISENIFHIGVTWIILLLLLMKMSSVFPSL